MNEESQKTASTWRAMSVQDLALWGIQDVAYVKRVVVNDQVCWSIHSADGSNIGMAPGRDLAFAAVSQHDLEPVSVH
ncbi:DUF1150 family protein [Telmatospirillum siberiense]|uniref:DUF1150 domain-containing protein n=1 Tax=Telmatospirillum siberiense TaxID=382514 RepID=A0A2N3PSP2_9PROT|nr:DUF1150 family protein [Telmatospirillum siberiense]PKU23421.1 hypothetical protein CWS72_16300 [Telmatospirillum siberiense]